MDNILEKLTSFNAWGMVSVEGQFVTVHLSAIATDGHPLTRKISQEVERPLGFSGQTLIAVNILEKDYRLSVNEIGETLLFPHPEVLKVLEVAVDWLRQSADL